MDAFSVQIKPIYTTGKCAGVVAFAFLLFATGPGGGISRVSADAPIQASQPAISLQQAIAERRVRAYAEPSAYGLQQKPMMHLVVIGGDSTSLVLYVAQGTTFSPPNSAYAPVVLTTGVTFTLNSPGPVNLWTLSLLHDRNSPSVFAPISYTVGAILTESHLTRVLAAWETNPMTSVVAAQLAVWSAYEGLPLSQLAGTLGSQVTQRDVDIAASLLSGQLKSSDPPASPTPLETVPAVTLSPASTPSSTPVIGNGTITNAPKDSVVAWVVLGILIGITGAVLVAAITISLRRRNTAAVSHHVTAPPSRAQNEKTTPDSSEMQKQVEDTTTVIRPVYQLVSRAGSLITQIIAVERELMISRADVSWIIIPDSAISAPQAAIDLGEPHRVKDLNSRNKTACGDKDTTTFVTIAEGEFIRVNTLTLHVTNKRIDVVTGGDPLQEKTWTSEIDFAVLSHHNIKVLETGNSDMGVSDAHALFFIDGANELKVKDLNSLNGTRVNDRLISASTALHTGDKVQIGASVFEVMIAGEQPLKAPCRFGDYKVECEIEMGGMAYVYKAFNGTNPVALKIPRKTTHEYRYRFQREAMITETLDYPGIVKLIQTGEIEGRMYIALQYVDGCSLDALLQRMSRPLMPGTAVGIIRQIATALDYAYQKGVTCHRDIKPSNLLLDKQGKVYVADFGIAKSVKDRSITTDNEKVGTEMYMSPEQKAADPTIDHRSDIYSLGIVLYEILGGTQLNVNSTTLNVTWQFNPPIPASVETILKGCLQVDRGRRFKSMSDLILGLPIGLQEEDLGQIVTTLKQI